jgi:hypothetical protein
MWGVSPTLVSSVAFIAEVFPALSPAGSGTFAAPPGSASDAGSWAEGDR